MTLVLNEEQSMLRESARDFLHSRAPVSHLRQLRDSQEPAGFSSELWTEMVDMGWAAILIPESYGGLEYGHTGLGLVLEQCGMTLSPSPLFSTALLGVSALLLGGNEAMCKQWLPGIASGEALLGLAFEESHRHNPADVATTAVADGGGYRLNGRKTAVIDGSTAHAFIVSARSQAGLTGKEGISLFLVPADCDGLKLEVTENLDNRRVANLDFNDVRVSESQLLGPVDNAYPVLESVLDRGRVGIAAELLGVSQAVFDLTVQYLKERKQFGVPIGSFQALQHRAATLFGEIELCKSVVLKALQALDDGSDDIPVLASLAKAKCGEVARLATAEAIQMHGGIGMTDEYDLGFYIKRWRSLNQQLGDSRYHLDRFASLRGY
jgi:alkylation response protein AidB-like acyl-CoA dehydrogenase